MTRRTGGATAVAIVMLVLTALAARGDTRVVAEVGAGRITVDDVQRVLAAMRLTGDASERLKTLRPEGRAEVLDGLIEERLFALSARQEGIDQLAEVQSEIDRATTRILARYYAGANVVVSDAAAREYYDRHPEEFRPQARVKARHILLSTQADAEAVLAALKAGGSFERLARERSLEAGSRAKDGDLGWLTRGLMVTPFEEAMFSLKPGEVSGVVRTSFGYHVVRVDQIDPGIVPPFEAAKDAAKQRLAASELARLKRQAMVKFPVKIHREVLEGSGK